MLQRAIYVPMPYVETFWPQFKAAVDALPLDSLVAADDAQVQCSCLASHACHCFSRCNGPPSLLIRHSLRRGLHV